MDKKGFTLVELLAVIIILTLLALLTSTAVTKLVKDSKEDLQDSQIELIKSAAKIWGSENQTKLPSAGECGYLTLLDLKEYGLVDSNVIDPNTSSQISDNLKIKVSTTSSSYGNLVTNYEITDNIVGCTKIYDTICKPVTTATTGNVPKGKFLPGDEYTCEVKPGTSYTFFVLSTEGNKVNLLLDRNININGTLTTKDTISDEVSWISEEDYIDAGGSQSYWDNYNRMIKGPITAIKYINQATNDWINLENLNEKYTPNTGFTSFSNFELNGKSRLVKYEEMVNIGCSLKVESCPLWAINYSLKEDNIYPKKTDFPKTWGYWTMTPYFNDVNSGCVISSGGRFVPIAGNYGLRPVITVSKYRIQNEIVEES